MTGSQTQRSSQHAGKHLLLFDGVCGLCNGLVRFVLAHDRRGVFDFASLQSATGRAVVRRAGGDPDDLSTFYAIADYQRPQARSFTKAAAALFVMRALGWPWKLAGLFDVIPAAGLNGIYGVIARHRYRVFGRREQCLTPLPQDRNRFVDRLGSGIPYN